jgi:hypothetical protein
LPHFKLRWIPEDKQESLKQSFIEVAKQIIVNSIAVATQAGEPIAEKMKDNFFDFEDNYTNQTQVSNNVELECLNYFQDPSTEMAMLNQYPTIRKIFEKNNTSLASSAPVERAFSYGGLFLSPKRSSLSDKMLDMLVVLKVSFD